MGSGAAPLRRRALLGLSPVSAPARNAWSCHIYVLTTAASATGSGIRVVQSRQAGQLDPRVHVELGENVAKMPAYGVGRDEKPPRHLPVAQSLSPHPPPGEPRVSHPRPAPPGAPRRNQAPMPPQRPQP